MRRARIGDWLRNQLGQGMTEYGIIMGMAAAGALALAVLLRHWALGLLPASARSRKQTLEQTRLGAFTLRAQPDDVRRPAGVFGAAVGALDPGKLRTAVDVPSTLWHSTSSLRIPGRPRRWIQAKFRPRSRLARRRSHARP